MYYTPMFLILLGIVFLVLDIFFFLNDYRKVTLRQYKRKKLYVNWLALISSFALTGTGIIYLFLIYDQLKR
ncbi:hypothetical protein UC3_01057 [Enterococcus phoeniculicola ATCC BAA-412]|jgi:hypothetical protein|uniref:Uncharacterized protein n=1 Tax=Enterococcus phoeniculicola ATCC BAA-412 TaxID=1158610 RepID=R3WEE8_9ENTE|nr:hypothetical protein UC3_01057 [Enterococcus phoeniculicola ATCC BAA-412]EOT76904.1 hypothetical protein I589_01865 [Enterococcus phoeniculicola ATCC BAA-412]